MLDITPSVWLINFMIQLKFVVRSFLCLSRWLSGRGDARSSWTQTCVTIQNACLTRTTASPHNNIPELIPQYVSSQALFLLRQRDSLWHAWSNLAIPILWTLKETFHKNDARDETVASHLKQRSAEELHLRCAQAPGDIKLNLAWMSGFKRPHAGSVSLSVWQACAIEKATNLNSNIWEEITFSTEWFHLTITPYSSSSRGMSVSPCILGLRSFQVETVVKNTNRKTVKSGKRSALPASAFTFRAFTVNNIQHWKWLTSKCSWTAAISNLKSR